MAALYETPNYALHELRVGATIINKATGGSVYFQPGDQTTAALEIVDAVHEVPEDKRDTVFDIACGAYV